MKRWSVFVVLVLVALGLLIAVELQTGEGADGERRRPEFIEGQKTMRLATRTPTVTRTAGWWTQVATGSTEPAEVWTPTPTGEAVARTPESQPIKATSTPKLDLPPVKTLVPPTKAAGSSPSRPGGQP